MTIRALRSTKPLRALGIGAVVAAIGVGPVLGSYATEGRAGLGDRLYPRYGNSGYDVSHYDIGVAYDPATERLTGTTTITARADQPLSQFDLDFVLTVQSVTVNGVAASFQRHDVTTPADNYGGELVIRPATRVDAGATMTIVVSYSGTPATRLVDGFSPWVTTSTGAVALGEPEAAAWWFPSNDHPSDKATYDISMTLPAGLTGVSNGVLVSHVTAGTGTTWHWRERRPMSTYLAFAAMGSYSLKTSSSHGTPVYIAVAHQVGPWRDTIKTDINRTAEVIGWESGLFGPYPFDAMGAVVPDATFGYALENESKPVYDREFWFGGPAMYVVAHENAHQWFGDDVSLAQWQDIWLNEGFATYAEWLWSEHEHTGTAQSVFDATYASHSAGSSFWTTAIAQPTIPQTFGDAVYDRGGMTLNALRVRLGSDAAFFQLLQDWVATRGGATGTTADFIALAERESGLDLTSFFHAWLYAKTRPAATAANGFPPLARAQLRDGTSRRPASWADLRRTHALLTRSQPAHGRLTG